MTCQSIIIGVAISAGVSLAIAAGISDARRLGWRWLAIMAGAIAVTTAIYPPV